MWAYEGLWIFVGCPESRLTSSVQCRDCMMRPRYAMVTKNDANKKYGLHDKELDSLSFFSKKSGRNFTMKLYLKSQVEELVAARERGQSAPGGAHEKTSTLPLVPGDQSAKDSNPTHGEHIRLEASFNAVANAFPTLDVSRGAVAARQNKKRLASAVFRDTDSFRQASSQYRCASGGGP